MLRKIVIGSRGSDLALWQANHIKSALENLGYEVSITIIKTQGDKIQNLSFDKLEGKGFFTKELEEALLEKQIDLAVHSFKDLPTESPAGLIVAAVSEREDPSELIIIRKGFENALLPLHVGFNGIFGTSSGRRKSQVIALRPDLQIKDLRGNVPTRIQKLRNGEYDAIMLASAGITRLKLDLSDLYVYNPSLREIVPAPAQGVLGLQIREDDQEMKSILTALNNTDSERCTSLERKILNLFEGGCQLPLGVHYSKGSHTVKVSLAKKDMLSPLRFSFDPSKETAETIVTKIKAVKPCNVFITKDLLNDSLFIRSLEANGFTVSGCSLIETNHLNFTLPERRPEWVFFSSPNGVKHFFSQAVFKPGSYKIGVAGAGTERELLKTGIIPDFTGKDLSIEKAALAFREKARTGVIWFPGALRSLASFSSMFEESRVEKFAVYETKVARQSVSAADINVFTSPSNVKSFKEITGSVKDIVTIAIGNATAAALEKAGANRITVAECPDETGLLEAVYINSIHL